MGNKPLSMDQSWAAYEGLFADDRVIFVYEQPEMNAAFRSKSSGHFASPKMWTDAWLLAIAEASGGQLITFDKALAAKGAHCLLPKRG